MSGVLVLLVLAVGCADSSSGGSSPTGPFDGGFVGFSDAGARVTECADCHPGYQEDWVQSAHASAYDTLEAIGREAPENSCAPCHNVSANGNETSDPNLGFVGTPVPELRNVQCENCHGPGAEHIADTRLTPDAALAVDFDIGCGECHQDGHHPFVEEWSESAHAESHLSGASFGLNVAGDTRCARCHVAQSFIAYVESEGEELLIAASPLPITCVTCHDPHGNGSRNQLRQIDGQPIVCTECHNSEEAIPGETPHHTQADMLLGEAGFIFSGETNPGPAAHGSLEINPDLCAGCHIATRDYIRGEEPIDAQVGHTFEAGPIDPATGERNFTSCLECHANPASILAEQQERVEELVAELEAAIAAVPPAQAGSVTVERAQFNLDTIEADGSEGVHNPRLSILLLESSIERVNAL